MIFEAGDRVQIRGEPWKAYLKAEGLREDRPPPGLRTVIRVEGGGIPKVLLDYPLHFWSEGDLEFAPNWNRVIQREHTY